LRKTPVNVNNHLGVRNYENGLRKIYFRDTGGKHSKLALAAMNDDYRPYQNDRGFNGLFRDYSLEPGEELIDTLIFAAYHHTGVLRDLRSRQDLTFYYTKFWRNIEEVLEYSINNARKNLDVSRSFERILTETNASEKEKWIAALSFHNDLACSFFLLDDQGQPRFYLVEGRFQHLSTIDVAHETEVMALFAPWRLKLQLQQWTRYLAIRKVAVPPNEVLGKDSYYEGYSASEFGPFLFHDVGDLPFVDGTSNYDYGPHMAVEENSDFVLLLYFYWKLTGDDEFMTSMLGFVDILLHSMINRDSNENGIADSGHGWTTYDVNRVLKESPDNSYLGVKQACAYITAAEMFAHSISNEEYSREYTKEDVAWVKDGEGSFYRDYAIESNLALRKKQVGRYSGEAEKIIAALSEAYDAYGYIPLSLDENTDHWNQSSVVIGEGLFLPGIAGSQAPQLYKLADLLSADYQQAFKKSLCDYGLRLSSEEDPTWFSKTMVSDLVGSYWYSTANSTAEFACKWNENNPFAYNDGAFNAQTPWTGYWYPRGVCSLWYLFRKEKLVAEQVRERIEKIIQQ
jgi:hypothetical protein